MESQDIRNILPEKSFKSFDDINQSRVLGATKHIQMIGQILIDIVNEEDNGENLKKRYNKVADYYRQTRGNQSRAVYNAINLMTIDNNNLDYSNLKETKKLIIQKIENYNVISQDNTNKIINYTNNIIEEFESILVFDYSSTLNSLIQNAIKPMDIYIAESRALDGGKPFIKAALNNGHKTHFFPDTTMYEVLKKCDAAFIGAESYYPDGTVFNTIGSEILGILCKELRKPLYVLTPLIKVDERNTYGHSKLSPMPYDFSQKIAQDWDNEVINSVNFEGIKLAKVIPELITAIVTEKGIIPPYALYSIAMDYSSKLKEGKN